MPIRHRRLLIKRSSQGQRLGDEETIIRPRDRKIKPSLIDAMRYSLCYDINNIKRSGSTVKDRRIIVDGMSFMRSGRPYYYNSNTRTYLHRYLWEKENGKIPKGYEIHHIDHNPLNNKLNNLEIIKSCEHRYYHGRKLTDAQRESLRVNLNERARPEAVKWHKSEEGREWHKEQYENTKHKLHQEVTRKCLTCDEKYTTTDNGANKFCSNKCKSKWRRDSGIDDVERTCQSCGNKFTVNKYKKTEHCSRSCTNKTVQRQKSKDSPN